LAINFNNLDKTNKDLSNFNDSKLLIVTKNQQKEDVIELLESGYHIFGENRVQEASKKFGDLTSNYSFELHLIGPLQTNKVKQALKIFNTIQTLDRAKLIDEVSKCLISNKTFKTKKFYIQVNIGEEEQKSGIAPKDIFQLYEYALSKNLNIEGLMCIPPNDASPDKYFEKLYNIKEKVNSSLKLSMGMSNDYKIALKFKSNIIRIGSLIFQK